MSFEYIVSLEDFVLKMCLRNPVFRTLNQGVRKKGDLGKKREKKEE